MSITSMTLTALCDALKRKELTPLEVVRSYLDRIHQVEGHIGAYISLEGENALLKAEESMDRLPLQGIPVAVKDNICIENRRMTCASRMLEHFVAPYSATAWQRLERAGCILLGKTNMDEFGMGSTTEHSAFHETHNPHDLTRVPGGSSGGSAAAVAAGEAAFALGSDTGGSIRQPAAHCGVVGMKPTYGTVSRYGLTAFASSLEQIGPITRTVADNALALSVMAGCDPRDGTSVAHPGHFSAQLGMDVKGLRIGLPKEMLAGDVAPEIRTAVLEAAKTLEALGAAVVEISMPTVKTALPAYYIISSAEASSNLARFDGVRYGSRAADYADLDEMYVKSRTEGFGEEVKRRILLGTYALSAGYYDAYYKRALQVRTLVIRDFRQAFTQVDCLLSPVTPQTAPKLGELADPVQTYQGDLYTVTANIAGIPALSMPCGRDEKGLPIGLQLMGPAFSEPLLYRIGHALEAALGPVTGEVHL
ncbi:MAG: Asp-tRNA(Asn)/Glu-tRNA(Gln) amidotransferase subunit GatA [Clostridia bacterium]|nr:Asp-tRNA(Asn)/Glu-tRNA(Gln) amidotransferase subunit GatA [Clostridia bacterium]